MINTLEISVKACLQNLNVERMFHDLAELLLNRCTLVARDKKFRLTEIEFYMHSSNHPDPFTHCRPPQLEFAQWYFHPHSYSANSRRKDLDFTFGSKSENRYAGILLCGMSSEDNPEDKISGPCRLVNRLFDVNGIRELACPESKNSLSLELMVSSSIRSGIIQTSPRHGLKLPKAQKPKRELYEKFINKEYRFCISTS